MNKTLGTVPSFASRSWHANSQGNKASKPPSRQESLSESIMLQKLRKRESDHFDATPETSGDTSGSHQAQSPKKSEYFSFPKVDGWSDYDDASSIRSLNSPAIQSLKAAQQALIKQPPLPRPVLSWNLPPILQVPLRWILNFKSHFWGHKPLP